MREWLNRQIFRQPLFWAIVLPVVLAFWALSTALAMSERHRRADDQVKTAQEIDQQARHILDQLSEHGGLGRVTGRTFDGLQSALECAAFAGIQQKQIDRMDAPKLKKLKDGSYLHRETYKLNFVRVEQTARFIDYAENAFLDVSCYDLSLVNMKVADKKDRWEATVYLAYLEK